MVLAGTFDASGREILAAKIPGRSVVLVCRNLSAGTKIKQLRFEDRFCADFARYVFDFSSCGIPAGVAD